MEWKGSAPRCYDCNNNDIYESASQKHISAIAPAQPPINSNTKTINKTEHCCLLQRKYDGGGKQIVLFVHAGLKQNVTLRIKENSRAEGCWCVCDGFFTFSL